MKRFLCALTICACGGSSEPPKTENDTAPVATATQTRPRLQVQNEFGTIDDKQAAKVVSQLTPAIQKCHTSNLKRVEFLGGDLKFYVRIGEDGHAKWVYFEDSSLGDREAEKCMLDTLGGAQWPKPEGGPQAELRSSFGFDAPGDVRQPTSWNSDKVAATIGKHQKDLDKCTENVKAKFTVTAYVEPSGKEGKVMAVGVATSTQEGAEKIDCLVDTVKKIKMPSPGSWAAKVSFQL